MANKRASGEGSIRKHASGRWVWEKVIGFKKDAEGNTMYYPVKKEGNKPRPIPEKVTIYAKSQAELMEKIRQHERREDTGTLTDNSKLTCQEWFAYWLKQYNKERKANTLEQYEMIFRLYVNPVIGFIQLKKLTSDNLIYLYNKMADDGKSARTRQLTYVVVGKALQDAVNCTPPKIAVNPNKSIKPIKNPKKQAQFLTPEQQTKLQAILDSKEIITTKNTQRYCNYSLMCTVALAGGLRKGEIVALHVSDLDFKNNRIHVHRTIDRVKILENSEKPDAKKTKLIEDTPKTAQGNRYVDMPEAVMIRLKDFLKSKKAVKEENNIISIEEKLKDSYVFATPNGTPVEPSNFFRAFTKYIKAAGLSGIKIHSLRHSYATRELEAGIPVNVVSEQLGHSNPSITMNVYQHVIPELKKEAAAKINHLFEKKSLPEAVNDNKVVEMKPKKGKA